MADKREEAPQTNDESLAKRRRLNSLKDSKWENLLLGTTASALLENKADLTVVKSSNTLKELLEILKQKNILSTPVVGTDDSMVGFVDVLDVAKYVLDSWRDQFSFPEDQSFDAEELLSREVAEVVNYSKSDFAFVTSKNASLKEVIEVFCNPKAKGKMHRVAVLDGNEIVNVITQSDIVAFAHQHLEKIPDGRLLATVEELNLSRALVLVREDSPFIDTLQILCSNRISGLALVDENLHLSGNLSASDLRGLEASLFHYFNNSTLGFLAKKNQKDENARHGPTISCYPKSTFREVIELAAKERVHRVYVMDSYERARGVVSLSDIIGLLKV